MRGRPIPRRAWTFALPAAALLLAGCRQDMHDQPKYEVYEASRFFADATSARPLPEGTVARGTLREDEPYFTGFTADDRLVRTIPIEVTARTLERGRETFNAFCAPCHDRAGTGTGMVVRRGFKQPPTYHQDRLRNEADGYLFDVITNGFGQMPSYAAQIPVEDRWAVVAYVRALQLAQHAPLAALPPEDRERALAAGAVPSAADAASMPGSGMTGPGDPSGAPPSRSERGGHGAAAPGPVEGEEGGH